MLMNIFTADRSNVTRIWNSFNIIAFRFPSNEAKHFFFILLLMHVTLFLLVSPIGKKVAIFKIKLDKYISRK